LKYFKVGRLEKTDLSALVGRLFKLCLSVHIISLSENRQRGVCLAPEWSSDEAGNRLASTPKVGVNLRRGVHDRGSVEECIERRKGLDIRAPWVKLVKDFVAAIA
jgi:hypothetical protein